MPLFASAQTFERDLEFGMQNDTDVTKLQEFLTDEGLYSGPITGNFFSLTLKAVKKFQTREGIAPAAGYFGPKTRAKVNTVFSASIKESNEQALAEGVVATTPTPVVSTQTTQKSQPNVMNSITEQIATLQRQLDLLLKKTPTPPVQTATLPNGAIVEIDASGNIIRYIKEAPQQTYSEPTTHVSISPSVSISPGNVQVTSGSAHIEWTTNVPTDSKLFLIQPTGSTKIISSASGNSTIHFVDIPNLISGTSYTYTIEAIAGTQSKKINGSFVTKQQTFTAESVKSQTNPNDTAPFLKLSSDRPFTIKKLVFLDDGTYCRSGYTFAQLTLQYSSIGKDAEKELANSMWRFVFDFSDGLTSSGITFRLTAGTRGLQSSYCVNEGMKFVLRDSESIIFGENGKQIDVPHMVLIGQ